VESRTGAATYPSAENFVAMEIDGTPLAGHVAAAGAETRATVLRELDAALEEFSTPDGFSFPIGVVVATGASRSRPSSVAR